MIDPTLIKFLSADDASRLREIEKTLESKGFQVIQEYFEGRAAASEQAILQAPSWDQVNTFRGALTAYTELAQVEQIVLATYTSLAEQNMEATLEGDLDKELDYE